MTGDMVEEAIGFNIENGEKSEKKCEKMLEKWWKIKFWEVKRMMADKNIENIDKFSYIGVEKLVG